MTNPDNAVGTNGAFGGRTSVNAFNDVLSSYASRGVISGWGIVPSSGMTLSIGGDGENRDVAIAADATNNKTTVNNISGVPIQVTLDSAPASNSRYDAIVVYVDKPPISSATQDNPECCGIIPVSGLAASSPAYPDDATIRSAITADGASGATAYYAILGYVIVAAGTTAITSAMITTMQPPALNASVDGSDLTPNSVTSDKIDFTTIGNLANYDISEVSLYGDTTPISTAAWAEVFRSVASPADAGTIILILARATFSGNNSGDRGLVIRSSNSDVASVVTRPPAASGVVCRLSASWCLTLTGGNTFGVAVYQSSGADLQTTVAVKAIKFTPKS